MKRKNNSGPGDVAGEGNVSGSLRAGVAKSDITTTAKGTLIRDPLYAKALVLDDGQTTVVIVSMDITAIGGREISMRMLDDVGEDFLPKLRSRIQAELKIPANNILVNASHTHPPGHMLCSDDEQIERTFDAISRAKQNMVPVKVGVGCGYEDRITMNRTLRLKNGKHWSVRHTNPSPRDEDVAEIAPIDPEIGVLRIDRLDGRPLGVVYNFACHPLFGDAKGSVTANYPGIASKIIEDNLGHDAMALFLQGAGGDAIDVSFKTFATPRDVTPIGTMLGLSTLEAWRGIHTQDATLKVVSETIELPRRTDVPEQVALLQAEQAELLESLKGTTLNFKSFLPLYIQYSLNPEFPLSDSYNYLREQKIGDDKLISMDSVNRANIEKFMSNIRAMEKLARIGDKIETLLKHKEINDKAGSPTISAEVMGIKIGDCVLISTPVEALTEVGQNVKKASPYEHTFMAAFSNGYMHYGVPAAYYDKGGYEATECFLAPQWQEIYEKKASEIISKL